MSEVTKNKMQAKIKDLIASGYLEDAFNASEKLSFRHKDNQFLTNLKAQLNQAKTDLQNEKLSNNEYSIRINRITHALLELVDKALMRQLYL